MLKSIQQRDLDRNRWVKITMGVILGLVSVSMVITLVPGLMSGNFGSGSNPDAVATVGGQDITIMDVRQQLDSDTRNQDVTPMMMPYYLKRELHDIVLRHALQLEADRLGIRITDDEVISRIKLYMPDAWVGGVWQKDRYAAEIEQRGLSVQEFEQNVRDELRSQKLLDLVTDGIDASPVEVAQAYRWRNEKIKIDYALIKPADLAASIQPSDADLAAYFAQNAAKYQVPEKRSATYAWLDLAKLRASINVGDDTLRAYYNSHLDQYKVENRVHVEHILLKTIGKTDAEMAEIRKKAQDVLNQVKHGGNFEDLAKKYSEDDATKAKGGDLGWIVEGQTVPAFQQAAFSLPKGSISDLVQTQYGFHIIKVLDRETAHTKSFDEVRALILPIVQDQEASIEADDISNQLAAAVRQSDRQPLGDLAKRFNLTLGETAPAAFTDPLGGPLGTSTDAHQSLFELRQGELSQPLHLDSGWVILTVKDILPAHQGTLAEVHDQVLAAYRQEKSVDLARSKAEELAKRVQGGEAFDKAAQSLGLTPKTSDPFARSGSVPDVGAATQIEAAFNSPIGQTAAPAQVSGNWLVYCVVDHQQPSPDDFARQANDIKDQLVQTKQGAAMDAFETALEDRLKQEGKLTYNADAMKRLLPSTGPS